jgi:hypothetical protein
MFMNVPNTRSAMELMGVDLSTDPVSPASITLVTAPAAILRSRMTRLKPTKNHGRFLNVSHPKSTADPIENSIAALYAEPHWARKARVGFAHTVQKRSESRRVAVHYYQVFPPGFPLQFPYQDF